MEEYYEYAPEKFELIEGTSSFHAGTRSPG